MWGTIVWVIEYKKGEEIDYRVIHRSGYNKEELRAGMMASVKREDWQVVKIQEICNTFQNPKRW